MARSSKAIQRSILALAAQLKAGEVEHDEYQAQLKELNLELRVGVRPRAPKPPELDLEIRAGMSPRAPNPPDGPSAPPMRRAAEIAVDLQKVEQAHRSGALPSAAYEPARAALLMELTAATVPASIPPTEQPGPDVLEPDESGGKLITCLTCGTTADVDVGDADSTYVCPGCGIDVAIPNELRVFGPKALLGIAGGLIVLLIGAAGQWGDYTERRDAAKGFPYITAGMNFEQVRNSMGAPSDSQHSEIDVGYGGRTLVTDCWYWAAGTYQVCFNGGRVDTMAKY